MIKNKEAKIHLILLISLRFFIVSGQGLKDIKLDNKLSVLNDKAFLQLPTGAKNLARPTDIMSADHNINQETRLVFDIDSMRLIFFAQELYLLGDNNFFGQVAKTRNKPNFETKILFDKNQVTSVLSTPTAFDPTKSAILVNSLLVKTDDNSIFQINAYINPAANKLRNDFVKLTEEIFLTLTKGPRKTNLNPRTETLNIFGTKKAFKFNLPENYSITVDQKYDFQVFKFHKYTAYSDTNWLSLTVYTGHHPSYFHRQYGFNKSESKNVSGKFLSKKVEWLSFHNSEKQLFLKEQQIEGDNIEKGLIVHIAMLSNMELSIEELTKIVELIELK